MNHKHRRLPLLTQALSLSIVVLWSSLAAAEPAEGGAFIGVRMDATPSGQVRLTAVLPGSPAARGGLENGDLLVQVDGQAVSTPDDVIQRVRTRPVGARLRATILRGGQQEDHTVVLGHAPPQGQLHQAFVGERAPTVRLPRVDGAAPVDLTALGGRVVVLYFWSVWCGACRMATPELNRLERTLGAQGVSVLAISSDGLDELRGSPAAGQLAMPLLHDVDSKVGSVYWISAVPTIFILDQRGQVTFAGEGWDSNQSRSIETEVRRLLANGRP